MQFAQVWLVLKYSPLIVAIRYYYYCDHGFVFLSAALTVQFQPAVYTVSEGDQAELMVVLSMAVGMDVTVQLMTVDDSAMGMKEKVPQSKTLIMRANL